MKLYERERRTSGGIAVADITDDVNAAVRGSGIRSGLACVYTPDTACCVRVNEFETGLLDDFAALLRKLVPRETSAAGLHDRPKCVSMLLGPAGESIPVSEGQFLLGRWQQSSLCRARRQRRELAGRGGRCASVADPPVITEEYVRVRLADAVHALATATGRSPNACSRRRSRSRRCSPRDFADPQSRADFGAIREMLTRHEAHANEGRIRATLTRMSDAEARPSRSGSSSSTEHPLPARVTSGRFDLPSKASSIGEAREAAISTSVEADLFFENDLGVDLSGIPSSFSSTSRTSRRSRSASTRSSSSRSRSEPLDVSVRLKEIPSIRTHVPALFTLGLSVLGYELVCARLCGEAQVITEPYEPNPASTAASRTATPVPVPVSPTSRRFPSDARGRGYRQARRPRRADRAPRPAGPARLAAPAAAAAEADVAQQPRASLAGAEVRAPAVRPLARAGPDARRVTLRLPRSTPPGTYEGSAEIEGRTVPIVAEVEARPRLEAEPRRLVGRGRARRRPPPWTSRSSTPATSRCDVSGATTFCLFDGEGSSTPPGPRSPPTLRRGSSGSTSCSTTSPSRTAGW